MSSATTSAGAELSKVGIQHSLAEAVLIDERKKRLLHMGVEGKSEIPCISIASFCGACNNKEEQEATAKLWDDACRTVGFVKVVDHGVPTEVIDKCWSAGADFFLRPLEEKQAVGMTETYPYGYQGMGVENLQASLDKGANQNPGDVKEMYNVCIGPHNGADDALEAQRWPSNSADFQTAMVDYYRALEDFAMRLYRLCAMALHLPEDFFVSRATKHRNVARVISYPAQETPPQPGQVRASTHTDYGALTLLRLGGQTPGGLQAMGTRGEWIDVAVTPEENAYVINLGDLMARWTNDRWLSTPHRVVNPPEAQALCARQSIAYFCNVNMDTIVSCIPTCMGDDGFHKYGPCTAGEHLMAKHQATVAGKLCYEKPPAECANAGLPNAASVATERTVAAAAA